jgi:hypothetical protein
LQQAFVRTEAVADLAGSCLPGDQAGGVRLAFIDIRLCAAMPIGALWSLHGSSIAIEAVSDGSKALFVELDHVGALPVTEKS